MFLFNMCLNTQIVNKSKVSDQLRDYVYEGNIKEVENILKKYDVDINNYYDKHFILLSDAVINNNIEMV
ncbi:ankyrin repeat-containing protein [Brachyspira murdochii DSM 12563]|uniref:Ankyrin repeat-containing protein n=1 Tax=Brachyspira murdochii (strain ATCC 51284 / DSM 12563 / 56-150) TaxID=526224 RepID=D5U5K3_BRAM5|nr:ankyrin repeat-containing protein [Brachyspira murdochii DSM 12563]